jgi:hypothetical protein
MSYHEKYLKYKTKYLQLKQQLGGETMNNCTGNKELGKIEIDGIKGTIKPNSNLNQPVIRYNNTSLSMDSSYYNHKEGKIIKTKVVKPDKSCKQYFKKHYNFIYK